MTPSDRFARCLAVVLGYEGGFSQTLGDPGGATNLGVTQLTLSQWRGHPCSVADVRDLTRAEASALYHALYWSAVRADQLPPGLDLMAFDAAVNAGVRTAAEQLQAAAGVTADGDIGPVTLLAVRAARAADLVERMRARREVYYRGLAKFPIFGRGWLRRLNGVATTAQAWASRGSV